jgi:hypothetical protein
LIEDQIVRGTTLFQSLEEYGLRMGQLVYAEFSNSSNEFPTDILQENKKIPKKSAGSGKVALN